MTSPAVISIAVVALFAGVVLGDNAVVESFKADMTTVKVGQPIVLYCWGNFIVQSTLHISKAYNATMNTTITHNEDLDSGVSSTRYQVSSEDIGSTGIKVKLTIKMATAADSGTYYCWLTKHQNETENITIFVVADPTSLHQFVDMVDTNATGSVNVTLTRTHNLTCMAYGSSPPANMSMFIGRNNVTYMAVLNYWLTTDMYGIQTYTTQLSIPNYQLMFSDYSQQFTCKAGVSRPDVLTTLDEFVAPDQSPAFSCLNDTIPITATQRQAGNFKIRCDVFGKPALTTANFYWTYMKQLYTVTGFPIGVSHKGIASTDATQTDNSGIVTQSPTSASTSAYIWTMELTVTDPGKHVDAGTQFNFQAVNSYSQVVHSIKIIGAGTGGNPSAGGRVVGSSFLCLLLVAVFARRML